MQLNKLKFLAYACIVIGAAAILADFVLQLKGIDSDAWAFGIVIIALGNITASVHTELKNIYERLDQKK